MKHRMKRRMKQRIAKRQEGVFYAPEILDHSKREGAGEHRRQRSHSRPTILFFSQFLSSVLCRFLFSVDSVSRQFLPFCFLLSVSFEFLKTQTFQQSYVHSVVQILHSCASAPGQGGRNDGENR